MIACLRLLHWAAAVMRQQNPALAGVPLVIGGRAWESAPVTAVSAEAQEAGVWVGMLLKQAWALCPGAHFLPPDEAICQQAYDALLDLLWDFSDRVEPPAECFNTEASDFYLDFGTLHAGDAIRLAEAMRGAAVRQADIEVRIGLAANRFTACAAAVHGAAPVHHVPAGQEAAFLAPLPVSLLPLDTAQAHRLALLGIHTLGQFAGLPSHAMLTQFGMQGPLLHRLARGEDRRPVMAVPCPQTEMLAHECEPPIEDRQLIEAILAHMSNQLALRLAALNMTCPEVAVTFEQRRGETVSLRHRPREAIVSEDDLLRELLRLLEQQPVAGPVYGLTIHLRHLQPVRMRQLTLFDDDPDAGLITPEVLQRLAARHGAGLFYEIRRAEQSASAYLPQSYRLASVVA